MKKRSVLRKIIVWIIVLVIIGGGIYFVLKNQADKKAEEEAANKTMYTPVRVEKGDMEFLVPGSGSIKTAREDVVLAELAGEIIKLNFTEGDTVAEGDVFYEASNDSLEDQLEAAMDNLGNQQDSLDTLKDTSDNYYIKSPVNGRVKKVYTRNGENASVTMSTHGGALAIISTADKMVATFVPEDGVTVLAGDSVKLTFTGGNSVNGTVTNVVTDPVTSKAAMVTVEIGTDKYAIDTSVVIHLNSDASLLGYGDLTLYKSVKVTGNGMIAAKYIKYNETVNRGERIFRIDRSDYENNIDKQNDIIAETQKQITEIEADMLLTESLSQTGGYLTGVSIKVGQNIQKGQTIASVVDIDNIIVVVAVDELDIPKVTIGQPAIIKIDALPDEEFEGKVTEIAEIGMGQGGVTTYDVAISFKKQNGVRIGMSANAEILVDSRTDVVLVPVEAIITMNKEKFVRVTDMEGIDIELPGMGERQSETRPAGDDGEERQSGQRRQSGGAFQLPDGMTREDLQNMTQEERQAFIKKMQDEGGAAAGTPDLGEGILVPVVVGLMNETYAEIIEGIYEGDVILLNAATGSDDSSQNQGGFGMPPGMGGGRR